MSESRAIRLSNVRYLLLGALLLALLAVTPLTAAAGSISGDAAYDPAAGSYPALFVASAASSFSGDDAYDPAAGSFPALFLGAAAVDVSGDAAYDPAAGGLAELSGNIVDVGRCPVLGLTEVGSYSGDDAYDPAVLGAFELPIC